MNTSEWGWLATTSMKREVKKNIWYIDSGATSHMTNDETFSKILERKKIRDDKGTKVLGVGSGELQRLNDNNKVASIKIKKVLYVPELTENLLAVRRLSNAGYFVPFRDDGCDIV